MVYQRSGRRLQLLFRLNTVSHLAEAAQLGAIQARACHLREEIKELVRRQAQVIQAGRGSLQSSLRQDGSAFLKRLQQSLYFSQSCVFVAAQTAQCIDALAAVEREVTTAEQKVRAQCLCFLHRARFVADKLQAQRRFSVNLREAAAAGEIEERATFLAAVSRGALD